MKPVPVFEEPRDFRGHEAFRYIPQASREFAQRFSAEVKWAYLHGSGWDKFMRQGVIRRSVGTTTYIHIPQEGRCMYMRCDVTQDSDNRGGWEPAAYYSECFDAKFVTCDSLAAKMAAHPNVGYRPGVSARSAAGTEPAPSTPPPPSGLAAIAATPIPREPLRIERKGKPVAEVRDGGEIFVGANRIAKIGDDNVVYDADGRPMLAIDTHGAIWTAQRGARPKQVGTLENGVLRWKMLANSTITGSRGRFLLTEGSKTRGAKERVVPAELTAAAFVIVFLRPDVLTFKG